jgi:molybdate transport system ATP-binding protein
LILQDFNFDLVKGQHWALIGKSGSGKSALLDAIAGKTSFSHGEVRYPVVDQYILDYHFEDPLFNRFKLISQVSSRHNFRSLSHTSNFYYQQRFNSTDSEDCETVEKYLSSINLYDSSSFWTFERVTERMRLTHLLDKQLIKLSNGETKRLLLAAALIKNPLLLLLDNPLTGLDSSSRIEFNELISEIAASGISIIMTTSADEIPVAITHVAVLEYGKEMKQMAKEMYTNGEVLSIASQDLDIEELGRLLYLTTIPDYHIIAGLDSVTIKYGNKTILNDVSWQIKQGERWMLLGANGAGKSTLLSLINGDNPQAFANKIILFDKIKGGGESIWDIKKKIGFVSPELFQYFPVDNSCLQVIESGFYDTIGLFRKTNETKAEICFRWMRMLDIEQNAGILFKNSSVSVQRLCLLARALVKNPALLILDEPCQNLDSEQQERFRYLIDEICRRSKLSLIYVSHYEHDKPECVTRILQLEAGCVV